MLAAGYLDIVDKKYGLRLEAGYGIRIACLEFYLADYQPMFHPSSQHISLRQQVIALSQSYPCPRCTPGLLEPFGLTETLQCNSCKRGFVPLRGGRFLYPSNQLGFKIAPTFWWDGFRWHWGGTTATTKQLSTIVLLSLLPVVSILFLTTIFPPQNLPNFCQPALLAPVVGLIAMQLMYLFCWDFDFFSRRPREKAQDEGVKDVR